MKTVFNNSELAHVFAQQTQSHGKGSSMFFEYNIIYSYGYHFPICKIENNIAICTYRGYSNTTAKHINNVMSAVSHYDKIYTFNPNVSHNKNISEYKNSIEMYLNELPRKRTNSTKSYVISKINFYLINYFKYCSFYGIVTEEYFNHMQTFLNSENIQNELKELKIKELAKAKIKLQKDIEKFNTFDINHFNSDFQYIRYNKDSNRFETSKQIVIPFELAKIFYNNVINNTLQIGEKLLNYTVNSINNNYIKIGCHTFRKSYLVEFGKLYF